MGRTLKQRLQPLVATAAGQRFQDAQLRFLEEQSQPLAAGERMLGSTEVLESVIGKYKRLQNTYSKGGMTAMLPGMGAIVGQQTRATIAQALATIRTQDVANWCRNTFGMTVAAQAEARPTAYNNGIKYALARSPVQAPPDDGNVTPKCQAEPGSADFLQRLRNAGPSEPFASLDGLPGRPNCLPGLVPRARERSGNHRVGPILDQHEDPHRVTA